MYKGIGIKTERSLDQRVQINSYMYRKLTTKMSRVYGGERKDSFINGAGKTGQTCERMQLGKKGKTLKHTQSA